MKIGGKAQCNDYRMGCISSQIINGYVNDGTKVILLPSAMGNRTDELLDYARTSGEVDESELPHYLVQNGEEVSGELFSERLTSWGADTTLVRSEDDAFFLHGWPSDGSYDNRGMDFVQKDTYLNCRPDIDISMQSVDQFLRILSEHDVTMMTAWALRSNGNIGLIKGRGGSDGSLVAISEVLRRAGEEVVASTKITDVKCIYDGSGRELRSVQARYMIPILEAQSAWPIQRFALEELNGTNGEIGVSHFERIDKIGTYISGI